MESLYLLSFAIAIDRYAVDNAKLRFAYLGLIMQRLRLCTPQGTMPLDP